MHRTDASPAARGGDDAGFTLVEMIVATAIIAVVMLGLGAVFVATAAGTDAQGSRQVAARLATDGLDRVHALTGANVVKGRTLDAVTTQWGGRPAGVRSLLSGLTPAYDPSPAAGVAANLPTAGFTSTVDRIVYTQSFYVAGCQLTTTGTCVPTAASGTVPMYDVVVSVTWRDTSCTDDACSYQLSTLLGVTTTDPLFNNNFTPVGPTVTSLAATKVVQDVSEEAAGPTVSAAGGNGALTLTASGLPAGVTLDPVTGKFRGTLGAVSAPTTVTVTATDRFALYASTTFTWTVNALPTTTSAAVPLVAGLQQTLDLASVLKLTGGTGPFTWSCTGLSLGATVATATGVLTVPAAALGLLTPTCTATDARGKSTTATLSATLVAPLKITSPATNPSSTSVARNAAVTGTLQASGGTGPYTWTADKLPAGVAVSTAGVLSGRPTTSGVTTTTFTVRDAAGRTASTVLTWTVTR